MSDNGKPGLTIIFTECEFCGTPTMDIEIKTKDGKKNICGQCFFDALELAHKNKGDGKR